MYFVIGMIIINAVTLLGGVSLKFSQKRQPERLRVPPFFSVKIIGFDDHLCRLWKCWNHGFSCKLLVATLWRPSGLLKEPCILCFFAANCQLCLVEGHFTYVLFLRMSLISDIIIINLH